MKHHKSKALEDTCLCNKCPHKFECYTQERIFSDPIFQGLFEALMAKGRTKEEALEEVTNEIKLRMNRPIDIGDGIGDDNDGTIPFEIKPWIPYQPPYYTGDPIQPKWTYRDSVTINDSNDIKSMCNITYHMISGEEISWECKR